jgi:hypothetical protein
MGFPSFVKDPSAILDYGFNWSDWLQTGETIASAVWTVSSGITKTSQEESGSIAIIWLSGGTDGESYDVSCKITTSDGRTDERTMTIRIRNK